MGWRGLHTGSRVTSSVGHVSADVHAEHLRVVLVVVHGVASLLSQTVQVKQMTWRRESRL